MENVIIAGGGASGIMAALTAAADKNNRVILLERQQRIGRKLLATGNGRCNLTNTGACPENYHGEQADFAMPALCAFTPQDTLDFFHALGLLTVTEQSGRVYPLSDSANSVLDVLRLALDTSGVELFCSCPVREIRKSKKGYSVICDDMTLEADRLIMACGGCAGEKLGGVTDGYELLKPLGHKRTKLLPSLVQLTCGGEFCRALKGVRCDCAVKFVCRGEAGAASAGELQFTEKGVSGPVIFEISRAASLAGGEGELHIDFFRNYELPQIRRFLSVRCRSYPQLQCSELLTGMLHIRLGRMLVKFSGLSSSAPLSNLTEDDIEKLAMFCTDFVLKLSGSEGFDKAQVTAGGIKTTGFNPETLESWFMPGLFCCGELLDVDGDCGGYNLQWAWASGHMAGRLGR